MERLKMFGYIAAGVVVTAGVVLAFLDSRRLRIGDVAILPLNTLIGTATGFPIPQTGQEVRVLVTNRSADVCSGTMQTNGITLPVSTPVTFSAKSVLRFERNGKVHPGGR